MSSDKSINSGTGALFRSLNLSFTLLRILIICLLISFVFSGSFTVKENEQAVILRFGKIVGEPGNQLIDSGQWHWAWPEPIDKVVRIPVKQNLRVESASFWFAEDFNSQDSYAIDDATLMPGRDGYLLTGDSNIIHLKTAAVCRIVDPLKYLRTSIDSDKNALLKSILDKSVQGILASWQVDEALYRNVGKLEGDLQTRFAKELQRADIGVQVIDFIVESKTAPRAVVSAFTNVLESELRKDTAINEARAEAETMITEASGKAANVLADAELYRNRLVSSLKADAEYFRKISKQVKNSSMTVLPLYSSALSEALESAGEKIILSKPSGKDSELRLRLSREPK